MVWAIFQCVWEAVQAVFGPWQEHVDNLVHYERNLNNFRAGVESLRKIRDTVKRRVNEADLRGETVYSHVEEWITDVDGVLENGVGESVGCFSGWSPNCCTHYSLGKEAKEKMNKVKELQTKGREIQSNENISCYSRPDIDFILSVDKYEDFKSKEETSKKIRTALEDEKIVTIGVYGIDVCKTNLVKEIVKQMKNMGQFDDVVLVELTPNPNSQSIQRDIASQLDLKLTDGSPVKRKAELRRRLEKTRTLVIFENVRVKLDFSNIGVPRGEGCKGCKIILIAPNENVCNINESQAVIEVGVPSELYSSKSIAMATCVLLIVLIWTIMGKTWRMDMRVSLY